mgnify:CR=1 FL=1
MRHISDRSKFVLGLHGYEHYPLPEYVDKMDLECPFEEQRILRMALRVDGKNFCFTDDTIWAKPMFDKVLNYQRNIVCVEHSFCYLTIRHGKVTSKTDDEWHVDGFSTKITHIPEQNYIWSNTYPTEYVKQSVVFPFDFNPVKHNINHFLQNFVKEENIKSCQNNVIYCLDPYVLHRRPIITEDIVRTFVRISFVPIEINDINNTPNPFIPRCYDKDGVKERNQLTTY